MKLGASLPVALSSLLGLQVSNVAVAQHAKLLQEGLTKGAVVDYIEKLATEAVKKRGNIEEIAKEFDPLSPDDASLEPDYSPPAGGLPLPSSCGSLTHQGSEDLAHGGPRGQACKQCGFAAALEQLNRTRYRLEKLRRVGLQTKNMISHSLALGDSMAGAAGVGGLAWVDERGKILQSYKNFQQAYDAKYLELLALLQQSLMQISKCEAVVYGEEDWYERFGFMYYEFMTARYARAD